MRKEGVILQNQLQQPQNQPAQQYATYQNYNTKNAYLNQATQHQTNFTQPTRGRIGVRGFFDPSVGITGIGISNKVAQNSGYSCEPQRNSYKAQTHFINKNQQKEDQNSALDIELGVVDNMQHKPGRKYTSNDAFGQRGNQNVYVQPMGIPYDQRNNEFDRQNSDQTAYMRNMRLITQQNHDKVTSKGSSISLVQNKRITTSSTQVRPPT